MESATQIQTLDKVVRTNATEKGMSPLVLSPAE